MLPTCENLMRSMGWACARLDRADRPLYVSTPLCLPGGSPLDFYLTERDGALHFTDDGLTLFELRSLGYSLDDRRNLRGLSAMAEELGFKVDDTDALVASFPHAELPAWSGRILRLYVKLIDWELDHFKASDADLSLAREVERIMRAKEPDRAIIERPLLRIGDDEELRFDFLWGQTYVDAVPPTPNASAHRVRKSLQYQRGVGDVDNILYVLDDRPPHSKAAVAREFGVISQVARVTRLSQFAEAA